MKTPFFSIIIPVRCKTFYLQETILHLKKQTFKDFELLVITDQVSGNTDPSFKRNLGAKKARGSYLAFLDDDSFPHPDWLKNCVLVINHHPHLAGFCGPCLTPPHDNYLQQTSGVFWGNFSGSGGAGEYRNSLQPQRYVDDYPTVNLIIRSSDFHQIGGFQSRYWPGEDTILCLDITQKLHQKILYDPSLIVYHHRRCVLIPHLQQIKRYALHRGFFAKKFPQTSFRPGYFLPSALLIYFIFLPIIASMTFLILIPLYLYFAFIFQDFLKNVFSGVNFIPSFLAMPTTFITHLYYGFFFIIGLMSFNLKYLPHRVNPNSGNYVGG